MTIQTRKPAINQCKVHPLNFGEWTDFQVQGTCHDYHVYIPKWPIKCQKRMLNKSTLTYYEYCLTCHSKEHADKFPVCKGNSNGAVCRHCLAAINDRIRRVGKQVSWPEDGELRSAVKLLNLGGQLIKIRNQNGKSRWGVVR